ncbi:MAG: tetratricopeptide repeat protein [Planctomycetota bacterium]|nr:tetratricopeptide repeat protein [Planctomycetota bacterium]
MNFRRTTRLRLMKTAVLENPESDADAGSEAEGLFVQGLACLLHQQDFKGALEKFREARDLFEDPSEQAVCLIEESHIHSLLGRSDDAIEALRQARQLLPEERSELRGEASFVLARLLSGKADFDAALAQHFESKPYYEHRENLNLSDYFGFETWIQEKRADFQGWATAVHSLVTMNPDKLALNRIPPDNKRTRARCDGIVAGLDTLIETSDDLAAREWARALKAMTLYIARQPEDALAILGNIGPEHRNDFMDHLTGKCLLRLQRPEEALLLLERVAAERSYFDLSLDLAMVYEVLGKYEEALAYYQRLGELDPEQVLPIAREALLKDSLNDKVAAMEAYQRLTERDPKNRAALSRLALLNAELGRDEDALQWLNRALKGTGPEPTLLIARARVLLRQGELKMALRDGNRALELLEPLIVNRGEEVTVPAPGADDAPAPAGNPEAVGEARGRMAESATKLMAQGRLILAQIYHGMGRVDEAEEFVDYVLAELPENEEAQLLKGDCARAKGSPRDAADSYKNLIDQILCDTLLRDGLALSIEGRFSEALVKYRAAYEKFPRNWKVFYNAALAYTQLGEFDSAVKYLAIARKINKDVWAMVDDEAQFQHLRESELYERFHGEG